MVAITTEIIEKRLNQIDEEISDLRKERTELFKMLSSMVVESYDELSNVDLVKDTKTGDLKKMSKHVLAFLRDMDMPMSIRDIASFLEQEFNYKVSTPSNAMIWMMKHEPRIRRARKGFYEAL